MERQEISILDLGVCAVEMQRNWQNIKNNNDHVIIKECKELDTECIDTFIEMYQLLQTQSRIIAKEKQALGIQKAKEIGVQLGRKPLTIPEDFVVLNEQRIRGEITITDISRKLKVDFKTVKKWIRQTMK